MMPKRPYRLTSTVQIRNKQPLFYSIHSNNCQHFILDLCEYMDLQFDTSNVHALWLKSRLAFLAGCLLQLGITMSLPAVTTWALAYGSDLVRALEIPSHLLPCSVSLFAAVGLFTRLLRPSSLLTAEVSLDSSYILSRPSLFFTPLLSGRGF